MCRSSKRAMDNIYPMPLSERSTRPRSNGLTMVIDMGSGLSSTRELLEIGAEYIDIMKLSSGSAALYPEKVLIEKIEIIKSEGIEIEAGGSHFEVANWKGFATEYFKRLIELKIDVVEIADGHLPVDDNVRLDRIKEAKDLGLKVAVEIGKKEPDKNIKAQTILEQYKTNTREGADYIIIEGKASGVDVGIFDEAGEINESELKEIIDGIDNLDKVLWEAPLRPQQQALILRLGPNVSLGNIFPQEVYPLELMRNGLMLMPLINAYQKEQERNNEIE